MGNIKDYINLERYPLDRPDSKNYAALIARSRADINNTGMFNLEAFIQPKVIQRFADQLKPVMQNEAFTHKRKHNIYFKKSMPGIASSHPALSESDTINRTLCADQISQHGIMQIYEWPPFARFLAAAMQKTNLYLMLDPLARVNVMAYRSGEALNWHFDRSEFTTTLLLQAAKDGGQFQYRKDLRTPDKPNFEGVAKLLSGQDPQLKKLNLAAGTLNVFRGINTAHRVTPVIGSTARMIAVFSYYESPDVVFSEQERLGFYGRTE